MNAIKGLSLKENFLIQELIKEFRQEAFAEGVEVGKTLASVKNVEEPPYNLMHGFVWEVILSNGEKQKILTEGQMFDEALKEFRKRYGYDINIFSITYLDKQGEFDAKH